MNISEMIRNFPLSHLILSISKIEGLNSLFIWSLFSRNLGINKNCYDLRRIAGYKNLKQVETYTKVIYSCLESNTSDKLEPELSPNNSIFEQKAEIRNL